MAKVKVEQRMVVLYDDKYLPVVPKPKKYCRRILVEVSDEVVRNKEVQPVIDAYALAIGRSEMVGKTMDELRSQFSLELGFHRY
ncbi:hypothetical protein [Paenibacillus sp. Leaf72]|uniref:hypothetical protein n=1 Tax=Paenibacillus sp. Leaf72 TaxID=1736234 RepID=UPI0006F55D99|nr:hypothetical protein [Paenibacillus sp. Leaf72]KQN96957.1 hypothetical protein ASF12_23085 [Paenibacillus sp. Leaf72]